jgi:hypothetical protein
MRFDILWSESQKINFRDLLDRGLLIPAKVNKLVLEIIISFIGIISNKKRE